MTAQFDLDALGWRVLLLGGASGTGKSTVAMRLGQRLGIPWLQIDDFRLALEQMGWPLPDSALVPTYDGPGGLIEVATLLAPAVEIVIANHVAQRNPAILEGDGVIPALFERPALRRDVERGAVRAIFVYESEERIIRRNMQARGRALSDAAHARKNWQYGEWLRGEAEARGIPALPARPWDTLEDRILAAANTPLMPHAAFRIPHSPGAPS